MKYLGAGVNEYLFENDCTYRNALLGNFSCLYPHNAFKFSHTVSKTLDYNFEMRDIFLAALPSNFKYRINCLFWDYSMRQLKEVSPGKKWELIAEWIKQLLDPVDENCIAVDVVNEPIRIKYGKAVHCSLSTLLGEDWIERSLALVRSIRPDLPLFICQHEIGYLPIQEAFKTLMNSSSLTGVNSAIQCTASSFAVNKFDGLSNFLNNLPNDVHVPEITIWRYRAGNKPIHPMIRHYKYWQKSQVKGYMRVVKTLLYSKSSLIGFWEPIIGRSFFIKMINLDFWI